MSEVTGVVVDPVKTPVNPALLTPDLTTTKTTEPIKTEPNKTEPVKVEPLTLEQIKLPEGTALDKDQATKLVGILNDQNLTPQARLQGLFDLHNSILTAASEKGSQQWDEMQAKWTEEAQADSVIGGEKLAPALSAISKLIDKYSVTDGKADKALGDKFREVMDLTGAGNNPTFIRVMAGIAKDLAVEGSPVPAVTPAGGAQSAADLLYPNHPSTVR